MIFCRRKNHSITSSKETDANKNTNDESSAEITKQYFADNLIDKSETQILQPQEKGHLLADSRLSNSWMKDLINLPESAC